MPDASGVRVVTALRFWSPREAVLAALALVVYGWAFPFFPRLNNPNELVRVYMARALAEHRTYVIATRARGVDGQWTDRGPVYDAWGYVNDRALVCNDPSERPPSCSGRLYAAKAPGASFAAVPVVAVLDAIHRWLLHREPTKDAYVLALRWALGIVPTILMWLAIRRFLLRLDVPEGASDVAFLAGALGSLSLTYGQMFAGHQLASLGLALAFLAAFWPPGSGANDEARGLLVGLGAALAISAEYPSAPAAAIVVGGWVLSRRPRVAVLGWALAGALPSVLLTARFHTLAFGAPWRTAYGALENPTFVRDLGAGPLGLSWPSWESVSGSLLSPRLGLLFWAPWIVLVVFAAGVWCRRRSSEATHAGRVACLVVGYYVLFQCSHALWRSGWTVGPRYMTPVAPFAAVAVALSLTAAARRTRGLVLACLAGTGAAAILATGLASLVCQGFPPEAAQPLVEVVGPLLHHGYVARNPLQAIGVPGVWSALPTLLCLGYAALLCLRAAAAGLAGGGRLATGLLLLVVGIQWTWPRGIDPAGEEAAAFLAEHWEPAAPPGAHPFRSEEEE